MKWENPELLLLSARAHGELSCSPTGSLAAADCSTGFSAGEACHTGRQAIGICDATGTNYS